MYFLHVMNEIVFQTLLIWNMEDCINCDVSGEDNMEVLFRVLQFNKMVLNYYLKCEYILIVCLPTLLDAFLLMLLYCIAHRTSFTILTFVLPATSVFKNYYLTSSIPSLILKIRSLLLTMYLIFFNSDVSYLLWFPPASLVWRYPVSTCTYKIFLKLLTLVLKMCLSVFTDSTF